MKQIGDAAPIKDSSDEFWVIGHFGKFRTPDIPLFSFGFLGAEGS
jgi:hypothetical protein